MTPEQEQRIDDSYGQVAHEAFLTHMPGRPGRAKLWRLLSAHERNAWIEVGKKVRDVFAAACSV